MLVILREKYTIYLLLMMMRATPKYDYFSPRGRKIVSEVCEKLDAARIEQGDIARIATEHKIPPR
jgi:hypothetical protein